MSGMPAGTGRTGGPDSDGRTRPPIGETAAATRRTARLMLPLRFFLGATFMYAGLVKLTDPAFLDAAAPTGLVAQLHDFARTSPLQPLIDGVALHWPVETGLLVATLEIAVGLGALTGLAARASAWGGLGLSVLLWLTSSWSIAPYFLGPDLPYAFGWLTLALIGDGGLYTLRDFATIAPKPGAAAQPDSSGPRISRRALLESSALAIAALFLAGTAWSYGQRPEDEATGDGPEPSVGPAAGGGTATATGTLDDVIGTRATLDHDGSATFTDPISGDPGVLVTLADGTIVAFDAVCTHAGCTVEYVATDRALECPCHGAAFDPAARGAVLAGPASTPLRELPISVNPLTGAIALNG